MKQCKKPAVSVIMSIYNQWNRTYLDEAIMSVLNQTFQDFEFIIYNDGSDEVVSGYLQKYANLDKRIILINNPKNHGLAYSLNTCIDVAQGKYLARMDDDDICEQERLRIQYEYMEEHPEITYTGCNAQLIDDHGVWGNRIMPKDPWKEDFLRFSPFIHPTVMIRREVFEEHEAYRVSKATWRCEDYELFMRLMKLGYRGHNIQQFLFYYRENRNSYKKRKLRYRIDEMRLRYRNFRELGILYPTGWLYVMRPLVAAVIPAGIIYQIKKIYHWQDQMYGTKETETSVAISGNFEKRPDVI